MQTWDSWNPGLDNDDQTLRDIYNTLPGDSENSIHWLIRLFENPTSPIAFSGSIDLFGHDCIHILLGRGLLNQDEAFVLGFTMGSCDSTSSWEKPLFKCLARFLYPSPYRFRLNDRIAFDIGYKCGQFSVAKNIHLVNFNVFLDKKLGDVRKILGINKKLLIKFYAEEKLLLRTVEGLRLPTSFIVKA